MYTDSRGGGRVLLHALEHLGDALGAAVVLAVARRRDLVGARELGLGGAKVAEEDVPLGCSVSTGAALYARNSASIVVLRGPGSPESSPTHSSTDV